MAAGPVLVATDFSERGDNAIREGDAWARRLGAPLVVCHFVPILVGLHPLLPQLDTQDILALPIIHEQLRAALATAVRRITGRSRAEFRVVLAEGIAGGCILRTAETASASVVVLGATGKGAFERAFLRSTSEHVIRHSRAPILIARAKRAGPILAAVDVSRDTLPLLKAAVAEADRRDLPVFAMYSVDPAPTSQLSLTLNGPAIDMQRQSCDQTVRDALWRSGARSARPIIADGPAHLAIPRVARELDADLIVVGTHSQAAEPGGFLGGVAHGLTRNAPCSVLVVHLPFPSQTVRPRLRRAVRWPWA